jgi:hypothetical protein
VRWSLRTLLLLFLLSGCVPDEDPSSRAGYFMLSSQGTLWQLSPGSESFSLQGSVSSAPQVLAGDDHLQLLTCPSDNDCLALLNQVSLGYSCIYSIPVSTNPHRALTWAPPDHAWWLQANGQQLGGVNLENGLPVPAFAAGTPELAAMTGVTVIEPTVNDIVLQPGELLAITATPGLQALLYRLQPLDQSSELIGTVPSLAPITLLPDGRLIGCATDSDLILSINIADLTVDTLAFRQPVINPAAFCWLEQP